MEPNEHRKSTVTVTIIQRTHTEKFTEEKNAT